MRWRRLLLITALLALIVALAPVLILAETALRRARPYQSSSPLDAALLSIRAGDGTLLRAAYQSAAQPSNRCLILQHGVGADHTLMPGMRAKFSAAGFNVLLPDSRAHGRSEGSLVTFGLYESQDLSRWITHLAKFPCRDGVYVLGVSMGAAIALQTAARDSRIRAIIAESSFSSFEEIAQDRITQLLPPWSPIRVPLVSLALAYTRFRQGVDLRQASPLLLAPSIHQPVLLIHGTADTNIPIVHSERLHTALPTSEIMRLAGATHAACFNQNPDRYTALVARWIQQVTDAAAPASESVRAPHALPVAPSAADATPAPHPPVPPVPAARRP